MVIPVLDTLKNKHHQGTPVSRDALISPSTNQIEVHPVIFGKIDASLIRFTAVRTSGLAGPSCLDAKTWKSMCTSYSNNWRTRLMARRLASSLVDPERPLPFLPSRLAALDKNPGVRPIRVCEIVHRIITKAILIVSDQGRHSGGGWFNAVACWSTVWNRSSDSCYV